MLSYNRFGIGMILKEMNSRIHLRKFLSIKGSLESIFWTKYSTRNKDMPIVIYSFRFKIQISF